MLYIFGKIYEFKIQFALLNRREELEQIRVVILKFWGLRNDYLLKDKNFLFFFLSLSSSSCPLPPPFLFCFVFGKAMLEVVHWEHETNFKYFNVSRDLIQIQSC